MKTYQDQWTRYHDKPTDGINPSSNNGGVYTAYAVKSGLSVDRLKLKECFDLCCKETANGHSYLIRNPNKELPPISRDEVIALAYLGFLKPSHLNGWNFSPYPLPKFSLVELVKQLLELRGKHRNHFWQNNFSQVYHVAFSVPLQDRAFLLECWGETKSLRYFFYKGIAMLDAKFGKPKNGIHWLKYGGEKRKRVMQQEFPEDHPLRKL